MSQRLSREDVARYSLVVVSTNPGSRSNHCDDDNDEGDDTPCEDYGRSMLGDMVLEGPNDQEYEPSDAGRGASRVNTTELLNETCQEDTQPQWRPL